MSTMLLSIDLPWMKPLCSSAVRGPSKGSNIQRQALAINRLSALVMLSGLTPSTSYTAPPSTVPPQACSGRG
eukprot:1379656-Pyramimonas_sp.AAC.1